MQTNKHRKEQTKAWNLWLRKVVAMAVSMFWFATYYSRFASSSNISRTIEVRNDGPAIAESGTDQRLKLMQEELEDKQNNVMSLTAEVQSLKEELQVKTKELNRSLAPVSQRMDYVEREYVSKMHEMSELLEFQNGKISSLETELNGERRHIEDLTRQMDRMRGIDRAVTAEEQAAALQNFLNTSGRDRITAQIAEQAKQIKAQYSSALDAQKQEAPKYWQDKFQQQAKIFEQDRNKDKIEYEKQLADVQRATEDKLSKRQERKLNAQKTEYETQLSAKQQQLQGYETRLSEQQRQLQEHESRAFPDGRGFAESSIHETMIRTDIIQQGQQGQLSDEQYINSMEDVD